MKYYVKDTEGNWLVKGAINKIKFDGNGKPYLFSERQATLLEEEFGYIKETTYDSK